jgi:hypothetical protein
MTLGEPPRDTVMLSVVDPVSPDVVARRDAWLGS